MTSTPSSLDVEAVRRRFPALRNCRQVFFDNAGGTQILDSVVESISQYLLKTNVQLGASYEISKASTGKYEDGVKAAAEYVNARPDEIVLGSSTTQLFRNLSQALRPHLPATSEIVVSALDHEANIASWLTLAQDLNLTLKWWAPGTPSPSNPQLTPSSLLPLLSDKTRLVTATHTSNILGTITDLPALSALIREHAPDAMFIVDGVAHAPHRPLDMAALGVDAYSFSWYKCYGPHVAQLYVSRRAQDRCMRSLGHYFKPEAALEDKLGLAAASYELAQSLPEVVGYLAGQSWEAMGRHEELLQERLLGYLREKPEVYSVCGVPEGSGAARVPVVSFVAKGRSSKEVVELMEGRCEVGFRWGHFYSKRLCDEVLGLGEDGVVRVSMVHYNTLEEVDGFIRVLDQVVCGLQ